MKLLAVSAEMRAIRTMCSDNERVANLLIGAASPTTFYYNPAREAFKVIMKTVRSAGSVPDWSDVCNDPSIKEEYRKILKDCKELPIRSSDKAKSVLRTLDKYRKLRGLLDMAKTIYDNVEDDKVDLDELMEDVTDQLTHVRVAASSKSKLWHIGKGNNTTSLVKESLYGKVKPSAPTGFRAFDDRNGGILWGSLFTIGANTGGGKTAMAVNLLRNMTKMGVDCCIVPLEMTAGQTMDRLNGIGTGIEVNKISQKRLSTGEKKKVKNEYVKYVRELKETGTRYSIYESEEDMTIEEVLLTLKPYKYKVILIDYISLLKGADGDDQWRQLGNISRFAKVFAKNNDCIVVLLCQVTEEGKIRYAQAIAENSNNAWIWTMPGDDSETSIMDIKQLKARNQLRFNFQLQSHNPSMRITDLDGGQTEDRNNDDSEDEDKLPDVNEPDDDAE